MSFGTETYHFRTFPVVHGPNPDHDPLSPYTLPLFSETYPDR